MCFYVPQMKKNLLSVSQLCSSNNVFVEFYPSYFVVKDCHTGAWLMEGRNKDGVYEWTTHASYPSPVSFSSIRVSSQTWHNRLGHPLSKILNHVLRTFYSYQFNQGIFLPVFLAILTKYINNLSILPLLQAFLLWN